MFSNGQGGRCRVEVDASFAKGDIVGSNVVGKLARSSG